MSKLFVDEIVHQSSQGSGTITLGASGETVALASGATQSGFGGVSEQDIFVLTSGSAISAATNTILSGMTRTDDNGFEKIGTGMSESSGTFTFPSTGYYRIDFIAGLYDNAANRSVEARIFVTTDNSTYNQAALGRANIYNAGANCYASPYCFFVFKVTDTSTHKVQLYVYGDQAFTVFGNTTELITYAGFTKLQDI